MPQILRVATVIASLAAYVYAVPTASHIYARRLLGSSFGVPGINATYDYIIVGGGTGGLALATRLAEQQAGSVAVVEAGGFYELGNGNFSQVPATDGYWVGKEKNDTNPLVDWGYVTTPQAGALGQEIHYARGKCLGGSSARNYMNYQRGTTGSYQTWADLVDDQSYTFDKLLPFFEKSVHFTPPDMNLRFANSTPVYDPSVMGDGTGPVSVTYPHFAQPIASWTTEGFKEIGLPVIDGLNSGKLLGQSYCMHTLNATIMTRESSETSYLQRALPYSNYKVYQSTMGKKILFNNKKKATGVIVDTQGSKYTLTANKEVIVSGGVFGSPQLLMASGIGPAATLKGLNIPVVANLPGVGQNMQDHIYFGVSYRVNVESFSSLNDPVFAAAQAQLFNDKAAGMYTNPTTDVLGWEKVPNPYRSNFSQSTLAELAKYPADWPELELLSSGGYLGFQNDLVTADPNDGFNYATLALALCTPQSRGNVSISSADTAVPPVINPNWLTDQADVEVSLAGFKRARQFWTSKAMKNVTIGAEAFPGPQVQTDAEIIKLIRQSFQTIFHGSCTCAMGTANDTMAVVDSNARVYGVNGLRVVDASAFPILPPGHPQSTIYAFAEKVACSITGNC